MDTSGIKKISSNFMVLLHPINQKNTIKGMKTAINNELKAMLKTYIKEFDGYLIDYGKVFVKPNAIFFDSNLYLHIMVSSDFYVFSPNIGDTLKATVIKKSPNQVGCLSHGLFNVVSNLPPAIKRQHWEGNGVKEGDVVTLSINEVTLDCGVPFIKGDITASVLKLPVNFKTSYDNADEADSGISSSDKNSPISDEISDVNSFPLPELLQNEKEMTKIHNYKSDDDGVHKKEKSKKEKKSSKDTNLDLKFEENEGNKNKRLDNKKCNKKNVSFVEDSLLSNIPQNFNKMNIHSILKKEFSVSSCDKSSTGSSKKDKKKEKQSDSISSESSTGSREKRIKKEKQGDSISDESSTGSSKKHKKKEKQSDSISDESSTEYSKKRMKKDKQGDSISDESSAECSKKHKKREKQSDNFSDGSSTGSSKKHKKKEKHDSYMVSTDEKLENCNTHLKIKKKSKNKEDKLEKNKLKIKEEIMSSPNIKNKITNIKQEILSDSSDNSSKKISKKCIENKVDSFFLVPKKRKNIGETFFEDLKPKKKIKKEII